MSEDEEVLALIKKYKASVSYVTSSNKWNVDIWDDPEKRFNEAVVLGWALDNDLNSAVKIAVNAFGGFLSELEKGTATDYIVSGKRKIRKL